MSTLRRSTRAFGDRIVRHGRDIAHALSVDIVGLVALAVIFPLTIRGLGAERYGQYTALYLVFGIAGLWVYAAPSAAIVQLVLQHENDSEALLRHGRRQALLCAFPVAIGGTAIAVALFGSDLLLPAVLVLTADFMLTSLANLNLAVVFAVDGVAVASRVRVLQPIVRAAGVALLAMAGALSIGTLVLANVAASGVLYLASARAKRRGQRSAARTIPTGRSLFRYSWYYAASMSSNAAQDEGENLVMASTRPAAELGQYAAAYRVVSLALIPCGAVTTAASRWFMVRDDRVGAQQSRTVRLAVPTAIYGVVAGVAILLGRDLIQWVAGSAFDEVATIAAWLCLLPLLHGLAALPPMGLLGLGRNKERMVMGFATSAVSIVSYLVLVPPFGWRGGVIGTYVSETATVVAGWILLRRFQRIADRSTEVTEGAGAVANG